jgi:hypothetical protein
MDINRAKGGLIGGTRGQKLARRSCEVAKTRSPYFPLNFMHATQLGRTQAILLFSLVYHIFLNLCLSSRGKYLMLVERMLQRREMEAVARRWALRAVNQ